MKKVMEVFQELRQQAKQNPKSGCKYRSTILFNALREKFPSSPKKGDLSTIIIFPKDLDKGLQPSNLDEDVNWGGHYTVLFRNLIYDPILPKPTPYQQYLNEGFRDMSKEDLQIMKRPYPVV